MTLVGPGGQSLPKAQGEAIVADGVLPYLGDVVHMTDGQGCSAAIVADVVDREKTLAIIVALTGNGWIPAPRPIERNDHPDRIATPMNTWHAKSRCPWKR